MAAVPDGASPSALADHRTDAELLNSEREHLGVAACLLVNQHDNFASKRVLHRRVAGTASFGVEHPRHATKTLEQPRVNVSAGVATDVDD